MRYFLFVMALFSAFFVSASYPDDGYDYLNPNSPSESKKYLARFKSGNGVAWNPILFDETKYSIIFSETQDPQQSCGFLMNEIEALDNYIENDNGYVFDYWRGGRPCKYLPEKPTSIDSVSGSFYIKKCDQDGVSIEDCRYFTRLQMSYAVSIFPDIKPSCKPYPAEQGFIDHYGNQMCAPKKTRSDCPEFGTNTILPALNNTASLICYKDKGYNSCAYEKQGSTYKAVGKQCSDTDVTDDYQGDPSIPDPDKCTKGTYVDNSTGQQVNTSTCPINPDKVCSNVQVNGEYTTVCPHNCGQMNGVFVCTGQDSDADGLPDSIDPEPNTLDENPTTPNESTEKDSLESLNSKSTIANNHLANIANKLDTIANSPGILNSGNGGSNSSDSDGTGEGTEIKIDLNEVNQNTFDTAQGVADLNKALTEEPDQAISEFNPTDQSTSWWTRDYETGVQGVWEEKYPELQQTELFTFLNTLVVSGAGSAPDMTMDFSALGLGQGSFNIDPRVYSFLSIFFLVITGFTCRKIIFGG
jgi:hypothetical protein